MSRGILDTSVLIATDVEPIPGELAISIISIAELNFGVLVAKTEDARAQRLARLNVLQRRFDPLPIDDAVSDSYGRLAARVAQLGHRPPTRTMNLLIAATAHAHGATLYTRNPDHLVGLNDLLEIATL